MHAPYSLFVRMQTHFLFVSIFLFYSTFECANTENIQSSPRWKLCTNNSYHTCCNQIAIEQIEFHTTCNLQWLILIWYLIVTFILLPLHLECASAFLCTVHIVYTYSVVLYCLFWISIRSNSTDIIVSFIQRYLRTHKYSTRKSASTTTRIVHLPVEGFLFLYIVYGVRCAPTGYSIRNVYNVFQCLG